MREAVARLWPEIAWIQNAKLRSQVTETWIKALERSPLKADDLNRIPFTLLVPNCPITFMEHKRCVVHIARESADRKSTRLNSSHSQISYAVFCLKKKKHRYKHSL